MFVVSAFLGWEVVWNSPQRDDDDTPWGEAFRRHGSQMLLGLVWAGGMAWLDLRFLWWLSPIVFSLILSPFVSVLSSRARPQLRGRAATKSPLLRAARAPFARFVAARLDCVETAIAWQPQSAQNADS